MSYRRVARVFLRPAIRPATLNTVHSPLSWLRRPRYPPTIRSRPYAYEPPSKATSSIKAGAESDLGTEEKPVQLTFIEEPLGIGKEHGCGFLQAEFGDRIGPEGRYELVRKLGWGSSASVWLARDAQEGNRFVAVKCYSGYATDLSKELIAYEPFLMNAVSFRPLPPGLEKKHCLQKIKTVWHDGQPGDGEHMCIVTEVMGGDVASLKAASGTEKGRLPTRLAKRVLLHTLKGLVFLHAWHIVHTDLKPDNIMFTRGSFSDADIAAWLASSPSVRNPPERTISGFVSSAKSQPLPLPALDECLRRDFLLSDLGHAVVVYPGSPRQGDVSPLRLKAPEVLLGIEWDSQIDIWMFGCLIIECFLGSALFNPHILRDYNCGPIESQLWNMMVLTGEDIPPRLLGGELAGKYFNPDGTWKTARPPKTHMPLRLLIAKYNPDLSEAEVLAVEKLTLRCIRLDPANRPTAAELFQDISQDPWWMSGVE